jgi:hypothetical protein
MMQGTQGNRGMNQIQEHMPVVCSNNKQFGTVDHLDGEYIKLTKDQTGQHHWIPMSWVTRVDDEVHVDRPGQQAMQEWLSSPPQGAGTGSSRMGGSSGSRSS